MLQNRGLTRAIERLNAVDDLAATLQRAVGKAVPQQSRRKDLLSGTWLGEPVHPPLTDVVIGCWTSAVLLDVFGGEGSEAAARKLGGLGVRAAVPTAASGASDWAELGDDVRRVGVVHASGNTAALSLFALSYLARARGRAGAGRLLSALGYGVAVFSAYLGGYLSFGRGVGVSQVAFEQLPGEWTAVMDADGLEEGKPARAALDGVGVLLVRTRGGVHAIADRCSHRGCSLADGSIEDGTVVCPCHGSAFRLESGAIVKGPATSPQPALETRVREGKIEVRRHEDAS
ncbi:MAG TPA: Rieske (2Fe-2S) protein [Actinomycetota bacterium]|nr:Rieske (2Fe-2S) protein [Actinomycetota bacterium]